MQLDVRVTRHGPLVSDAINANNAASTTRAEAAAARAAGVPLDGARRRRHDARAFLKLNEARNWDEFTDALRDFVVPSQNFVYADVDGHIGYYAPGRIPIRARGDGSLPAEGWTGDAEWTGWIPFDELPHALRSAGALHRHRQPPAGAGRLSVSARPRVARAVSRAADHRPAARRQRDKLTPDDFARIQADTVSLHAKALLPLLLAHARPRRRAAIGRRVDAAARSGTSTRRRQRRRGDFRGLVPPARAGARRRRARAAASIDSYEGRFSFITRFVVNTLDRQRQRVVRRRDDADARRRATTR